jgi:hypothetical protein
MAKPFDATLNSLIDGHVSDWAGFLAARCGVPMGAVTPLDTDLSVTLQPDRLFRIDGPFPAVLHLELESTSRLGIPRELLRYNAFAHHLTDLPVESLLVLLRPKANAGDQTGEYVVAGPAAGPVVRFRYTVVRVWQESVTDLLAAGPGVAPLALLTNEAAADLPAAFARFRDSLRAASVPDKYRARVARLDIRPVRPAVRLRSHRRPLPEPQHDTRRLDDVPAHPPPRRSPR